MDPVARTVDTATDTDSTRSDQVRTADAAPPPTAPARIAALDIARGIAILGTLGTNIWIFSHPAGFLGYLGDPHEGAQGITEMAERTLMALANGKFLGLLTLMFGIGLAIQHRSAVRRGSRWPGSYPVRAALLFLDGVLHYLLVVEFDVLMGYAVTGLVVAWIISGTPRTQRRWIIVTAAVHTAALFVLTAALISLPPTIGSAGLDPNPYADGSWLDLVALRIDNAAVFRAEPVLIFGMGIALFTLGARLLESGLFEERGATLRRRLVVTGAVALVFDLGLQLADPDLVLLSRYLLAPIVAMGLLSLIAGHWLGREPGRLGRRLGEVGRMALSCYIAQNLIASILFYGWGFGLNAVGPGLRLPVTLAAFVLVCLSIMVLAHLWLRRFGRGPVESLWTWSHRMITTRARPAPR